MMRVQAFRGDSLLGDETSEGSECFLGKDDDSIISLSGWRIGRRQVQLSVREGAVFVKDGGGLAPVKVNGTAINEYGPLTSTDVVEVSDYTIRVHLTEPVIVPKLKKVDIKQARRRRPRCR
ncbi:FHA domain-containing protein [Massilia sp. H-1]|nr:FHA domain-containing protein [Massilia sp. H-1]